MAAVHSSCTKVLYLFLFMCWFLGPVITVSIDFTDALWKHM